MRGCSSNHLLEEKGPGPHFLGFTGGKLSGFGHRRRLSESLLARPVQADRMPLRVPQVDVIPPPSHARGKLVDSDPSPLKRPASARQVRRFEIENDRTRLGRLPALAAHVRRDRGPAGQASQPGVALHRFDDPEFERVAVESE